MVREPHHTALPENLLPENYHYPPELFKDRLLVLRFDGGDDVPMTLPLTAEEKVTLMAKFALVSSVGARASKSSTLTAIARGETDQATFMYAVRKLWSSAYNNYGGLEEGDVELKAEELGIYEIIWPFNEDRMREAIEAERRGEPIEGLDNEAENYDYSGQFV